MTTTVREITTTTSIVPESCYLCGAVFGLGAEFKKMRLADKKTWYCPNGHAQHYIGKTEAEKLREQLGRAESRAQSWRDQAETAENRRRAQKGVTTKLKHRIANGVCPECKRSFSDLRQHMAGQHPTFATPEVES